MECTQRLDFECSQVERICPEQIGFLGILGTKYPIKKGPNKVGRDPKSCSIVLDLKSISRQHAVINILNGGQHMLMDLDSANKTRLNNKTLQAYVPVTMYNGDTVQFGDIFGVFRLLEDETDLPSTQALELPFTQPSPEPCGRSPAAPRGRSPARHVPDTPQPQRPATRLQPATVPESPDVSDKDDSFIIPSQPKSRPVFKSPSNNFVKASSKTIAMQPLGTKKIDNVFWNSSNKSKSFNLDESSSNGDIYEMETQVPYHNNESTDSINTAETQLPTNEGSPSIHNLATQLPVPDNLPAVKNINEQQEMEVDLFAANKENELSIYNADTQIPIAQTKNSEDDIFTAETQIPFDSPPVENVNTPENIFTANTQLPFDSPSDSSTSKLQCISTANTQLPTTEDVSVCKNQHVSQDNRSTKSTDDKHDIHNANTQSFFEKPLTSRDDTIYTANSQLLPAGDKPPSSNSGDNICEANAQLLEPEKEFLEKKSKQNTSTVKVKNAINRSDDIIEFEELDEQPLLDDFQSQPIVVCEPLTNIDNEDDIPLSQSDTISDDDFIPISQEDSEATVLPKSAKRNLRIKSDSSTDCEEDIGMMATQKLQSLPKNDDELTDCEEDLLDTNKDSKHFSADKAGEKLEDLAPQVLVEDVVDGKIKCDSKEKSKAVDLEDMLTQVITEDNDIDDLPTQVLVEDEQNKETEQNFSEEMISPFKIPLQSLMKIKKKDTPKSSEPVTKNKQTKNTSSLVVKPHTIKESDDKYYAATQEILDDLCSQKDVDSRTINNNLLKNRQFKLNEVPSSANNSRVDRSVSRLDKELSPMKKFVRDRSPESSDGEEKVNKFISNLSTKQVSEVIGVDVVTLKKVPSDPSDVEVTPKKVRPIKFLLTELPDSQEIKTSVSLTSKSLVTESSSESEAEVEIESQDSQQNTPILFHKKRAKTKNVKKELITQFEAQALPTRIITRTRKPTAKIKESCSETKKQSKNILKSKLLTDADDDVDTEIISENITRLRNKTVTKNKKDTLSIATKPRDVKLDEESESSKRSNQRKQNTTKNVDTSIDLTKANEEKAERPKRKTRPHKNNTVKASESSDTSKNDKIDSKVNIEVITSDHIESSKVEPKIKKPSTQNKITNYTATISKSETSTSTRRDEGLNSTNETSRISRSRNNGNNSQNNEKSAASEQDVKKRRRGRPKKEDVSHDIDKGIETTKKESESKDKKKQKRSSEPEEPEVRRSRRQRTRKEEGEAQRPLPTLTHEQSAVYSVSSESGSESPRRAKRARADGAAGGGAPSPKRTRAAALRDTPAPAPTPSPAPAQFRVLFTAFPSEDIKEKLEQLGAVVCESVLCCDVVVTLCVRRTLKLLCALGLGRPVVGARWLHACLQARALTDPWQHLLEDESSERRFGFSLSRTLRGPRGYLRGRRLSATPRVLPTAQEMKLIVECSGGVWCGVTDGQTGPGGEGGAAGEGGEGEGPWVVVSCGADRGAWGAVRARGGTLVNSEYILTGVLRQHADIQHYAL